MGQIPNPNCFFSQNKETAINKLSISNLVWHFIMPDNFEEFRSFLKILFFYFFLMLVCLKCLLAPQPHPEQQASLVQHSTDKSVQHLKLASYRVFFVTVAPLKVSDYIVNPMKKVSEFTYRLAWGVPVKKVTLCLRFTSISVLRLKLSTRLGSVRMLA